MASKILDDPRIDLSPTIAFARSPGGPLLSAGCSALRPDPTTATCLASKDSWTARALRPSRAPEPLQLSLVATRSRCVYHTLEAGVLYGNFECSRAHGLGLQA